MGIKKIGFGNGDWLLWACCFVGRGGKWLLYLVFSPLVIAFVESWIDCEIFVWVCLVLIGVLIFIAAEFFGWLFVAFFQGICGRLKKRFRC